MPPVILISGSPSSSPKSNLLLDLTLQHLGEHGLEGRLIAARDFPPAELVLAKYDSPVFEEAKKLVSDARGIVVATPIYKASYTGLLKCFLDILPQYAFRGKTLLPLATGGSPGHLLAIDFAIKPLLSALAATDILQGVYTVDAQYTTDPAGKPVLAEEIRHRLAEAVKQFAANVKARV